MKRIYIFSLIYIFTFPFFAFSNNTERFRGIDLSANLTLFKFYPIVTPSLSYIWSKSKVAHEFSTEMMFILTDKDFEEKGNSLLGLTYSLFLKVIDNKLLIGPCIGLIANGYSFEKYTIDQNGKKIYKDDVYEINAGYNFVGYKINLLLGTKVKAVINFRQMFGIRQLSGALFDDSGEIFSSYLIDTSFNTIFTFKSGLLITF